MVQKQDESLAERTTSRTSADKTVDETRTERAAVRIQAASRGYLTRRRLKHTRYNRLAVVKLTSLLQSRLQASLDSSSYYNCPHRNQWHVVFFRPPKIKDSTLIW